MKLTVDGQDKILSINQNIALSGKLYLGGLPPTLTIDVIKTYSLDGNMKNIFCDGKYVAIILCYTVYLFINHSYIYLFIFSLVISLKHAVYHRVRQKYSYFQKFIALRAL